MMVLDMVPRYIWCAVFLLFCTNACSCFSIDDSTCDSPADTRNARTCESLFKIFENALLSNGSNLYKLKKLFYTGPPELASISYYLEFKNISNYVFNNSVADFGTSDELPLCSCAGASILNQTINYMINNTTIRLRYGWTTIDVYNFIHPALLNQLQIQLPFFIMRGVTDRFPFLWNGHNQLPSTNLHLFIPTNSLSCIPCNSQLDGVMKTLTSLVSSMSTTCIYVPMLHAFLFSRSYSLRIHACVLSGSRLPWPNATDKNKHYVAIPNVFKNTRY